MDTRFFLTTVKEHYTAAGDMDGFTILDDAKELTYYFGADYIKATGMESYGKPNVFTEIYVAEGRDRVYIPSNGASFDITIDLAFRGDNRRAKYRALCDYLRGNKIAYFDCVRKRIVFAYLKDALSPSEDVSKGSTPYIVAQFKFASIMDVGFNFPKRNVFDPQASIKKNRYITFAYDANGKRIIDVIR